MKIERFTCGNGEGMFENEKGYWVSYEVHKKIVEDLEAKLILNGVRRSNAIDYKKGFELAMNYINASPCDPDIYVDQLEMWNSLQDFVKRNKIK